MDDISAFPREGNSILDLDTSTSVCRMCFSCVSETKKGKCWIHPKKSSVLGHHVAVPSSIEEPVPPSNVIQSDLKEDRQSSPKDNVEIKATSPHLLANGPFSKTQNATVQPLPVNGCRSHESSSPINMGNSSSLENSVSSLGKALSY